MANTPKKDDTKTPEPTGKAADDTSTSSKDDQATTDTGPIDTQSGAGGEDSEPTPGDDLGRDAQRAKEQAFEDNPEHPEEALETQYLVGGEVPANAPGTEGLARE